MHELFSFLPGCIERQPLTDLLAEGNHGKAEDRDGSPQPKPREEV